MHVDSVYKFNSYICCRFGALQFWSYRAPDNCILLPPCINFSNTYKQRLEIGPITLSQILASTFTKLTKLNS